MPTAIAVYAGSFDPVTKGHMDLIRRGVSTFPNLYVGVGINSSKNPLFTLQERIDMLEALCKEELPTVKIVAFDGLLSRFCDSLGATVILRGLRAVSDFEHELAIAHANSELSPKVGTFFMPTKPAFSFVSSSTVKEVAKHGGDVSYYVDPLVQDALKKKLIS